MGKPRRTWPGVIIVLVLLISTGCSQDRAAEKGCVEGGGQWDKVTGSCLEVAGCAVPEEDGEAGFLCAATDVESVVPAAEFLLPAGSGAAPAGPPAQPTAGSEQAVCYVGKMIVEGKARQAVAYDAPEGGGPALLAELGFTEFVLGPASYAECAAAMREQGAPGW